MTPHATFAFSVRAPATSANLGPGFDALGLALDLWNEVRVEPAERLSVEDDGMRVPPAAGENLVVRALEAALSATNTPVPGLRVRCRSRIPMGRGLGSSAAAIAAGLLLGNRLAGDRLSPTALLDLAYRLEGHADNVTPALFGGVRAAVVAADGHVAHAPIPLGRPLTAALFVPDVSIPTDRARAALPAEVAFGDAVFNVGRASLLVAALASGELGLLREATRDRLHQVHRVALFPAATRLIKAALAAGALGAFTSGAGPTVLALCQAEPAARAAAAAMERAARTARVRGAASTLSLSDRGAHVVDDPS